MGGEVHSSAIVAQGAQISPECRIGARCVIGPHVKLARGVVLHAQVVVDGYTEIGSGTEVFPYACLGLAPQHLGYRGETTRLVIGENCKIREHASFHVGSQVGSGVTRVGDRGYFMVGVHVAHDCEVGDDVIMANHAKLGGHVRIADGVVIGASAGIHQYVRVGLQAMIGAMVAVERDIPPYALVTGERSQIRGLNKVGLRKTNTSGEEIAALQGVYDLLEEDTNIPLRERLDDVAISSNRVRLLVDFVLVSSKRGLHDPRRRKARAFPRV